jgi:ribonuclease Z
MRIIFLGTAAALPTLTRNVSAIALVPEGRSSWWLFDCGEATQHQLLRSPLSAARLERVFISHLHADHCFGLPGLLCTRAMQGSRAPLFIYGPPGIQAFIDGVIATTATHLPYPLHYTEAVATMPLLDDGELAATAVVVEHIATTLAFVLSEHPRPGRLAIEKLQPLGLGGGPLYGRLQRGERVTLADGRVIDGKDFTGPPRPGRRVVIVADTSDASAVAGHGTGADLLIHEATYLEHRDAALAVKNRHATAAAAARLATRLGARRLALTHFSPRYESGGSLTLAALAHEAAELFAGELIMAHDLLELGLPRPPEPTAELQSAKSG